ncbi:hypothetical protein BH20BAC1_BH20BAC1_03090 [soil metagenome]
MGSYHTSAQVKSGSFNFMLKMMLSNGTPAINVPEAAKNFGEFVFFDAREKEEYNVSHIRNARYAGFNDFDLSNIADVNKHQPIVVYCSIGKRSEHITLKLKKAGYTNVQNLYGGIFEWVNEGHPVYNQFNNTTDSVHAYSRFWGRWLDRGVKVYE